MNKEELIKTLLKNDLVEFDFNIYVDDDFEKFDITPSGCGFLDRPDYKFLCTIGEWIGYEENINYDLVEIALDNVISRKMTDEDEREIDLQEMKVMWW